LQRPTIAAGQSSSQPGREPRAQPSGLVGDLESGLLRGAGRVVDLVRDPDGGAAAVGVAGEDAHAAQAGLCSAQDRDVDLVGVMTSEPSRVPGGEYTHAEVS